MTVSNAAYLRKIEGRSTEINIRENVKQIEINKRISVLDSLTYHYASMKRKKQLRAEAMSIPLKHFGIR